MLSVGVETVAAADSDRSIGPVIAGIVMLAGLDLIGAALARSWADHRSAVSLIGGVLVFGLLFVVTARAWITPSSARSRSDGSCCSRSVWSCSIA